jgi:hypothetical protein
MGIDLSVAYVIANPAIFVNLAGLEPTVYNSALSLLPIADRVNNHFSRQLTMTISPMVSDRPEKGV